MENRATQRFGVDSLRREDYEFELPRELIAQQPLVDRDAARLMVLDRRQGTRIHSRVRDLPQFLTPGDLLVVNDTQVLPARVLARTPTSSNVELLFVRPLQSFSQEQVWLCLGKPARRLQAGLSLTLPGNERAEVKERLGKGRYAVSFTGSQTVVQYLFEHGQVPLPPYIHRPLGPSAEDQARYQTIFARHPGAVAAPTAGLHFSDALLADLRKAGVEIATVTLHVGPGTFQPIRTSDIRAHRMEPEWCAVPEETAQKIREAKARGSRVIAIGTTSARALESSADAPPRWIRCGEQWADCFIYPGYRFQVLDGLFTNFHLPGSTLIMLVAALTGRDWLLESYHEAIARGYRFYSYGDAMLVL